MDLVFDQVTRPQGRLPRQLGYFRGTEPGPTVIVVGGIHGNEPAGVQAIMRMMKSLESGTLPFRGEIYGVTGNIRALEVGERYLDVDLNRIWTVGQHEYGKFREYGVEAMEHQDLRGEIHRILDRTSGPVSLLDLHTTSAMGPPFSLVGAPDSYGDVASFFPVPVIQGLIDRLPGTLVHYLMHLGHRAFVFEGGQHAVLSTVDNIIAALYIFLSKTGNLDADKCPQVELSYDRLAQESEGLPRYFEVKHRHAVFKGDRFEMLRGFKNFEKVEKGTPLAQDRRRVIHAPMSARILMPLYQGQGTDGFFLGLGRNGDGSYETLTFDDTNQ